MIESPGKGKLMQTICGELKRQETKRYIVQGHELTSGDVVEVLVNGIWEKATVESCRGEYYLTNDYPINGATVRILR